MEKHTVVGETHQCSGSNLVSKSVDSSIKIDSISIDLINANEKSNVESCDHFSIRKYVSDIRKKDWKVCWPFASDDDGNKCDEHECGLPPLCVPKFRYWRCQNCLREIGAGDVETDHAPILKTSSSGFKSNIICSHASILQDGAVLLYDLQHPDINIQEGKKIDVNASANMNRRETNTEVTDFLTLAHNMVSDDNSNKELHQLTSGLSSLVQKTQRVDDKVNLEPKCNGSIGNHEVASTKSVGNLNCVLKNAAKINVEGKVILAADQQKELVACDVSGEHSNNITEARKASKGNGFSSPEIDECNNASSDSAEVMPVNALCRGSSSGLHRRKTRKVRLLTELLYDNGDGDTNNIKVDDSQLNDIPDASAAGDKRLDLQGQAFSQGNARRVLGQHRKRKSDQDEDWRPLEMASPNKACQEVRILKRDAESAETIAKAFARMHLQSSMKNHCTKHRNDGSPVLGKKKYKALIFDDIVPVQNVSIGDGVKTGDASTSNAIDGVLPNTNPKSNEGRETEFFPLSAQRTDRKPTFTKKSKILHVDDHQASLIPRNRVLKEDLTTRKDMGFLHVNPVRIPFHSGRDASSEKGQNLSLNSYLTMQRYDMQHNPLVEDIETSLLSWRKDTAREDQVSKKAAETNCVRNFTFASTSTSNMSFGKGICSEMSNKGITHSMPLLGETQNYTSQVEIGSCSHMQKKNFCSANDKKKAIEVQERSIIIRKDNDQRANKTPEHGNVDDIPMEIVELMAKHQYERCLPDSEHDRCQTVNFNKAYGNREVSFFQQGTTQKRNPRAKINRNGITNRGENLRPMKQKVDYFCQADVNQFTMSQLHQTPVPAGYQAFFQHQEKSSSRIQHSGSASGQQNSAQNCKWIGDLMGKSSSHNCLQNSGTCNSCMSIQQNRSTNHIWSSMMPNHMPFLYTAPQKCTSLSTNVDVLSNSHISVHKENVNGDGNLKFPNQNAASIGKQNRNFGSEVLRTYPEQPFSCKRNGIELNKKPMGSLDLYANETIPAMHLLSLMDAGLRSSAPINLDAHSKFLKRTSKASDQDPKEFSRPDSGAYKVSNTMKHTSYDPSGKNKHPEDSHGNISAIPPVVGPSSLFQQDKCFKKAIDFTSQVSQDKVKGKGPDSRGQNKGYRSQKPTPSGGNFGSTYCGSVPVHSMHTTLLGGSDPVMFPLQYSGMGNSTKNKLEAPNGTQPGRPPKSSSDTGICSVNRNPADFSVPEAGNLYMIAGKDLKFRRVVPLGNGYGSTRWNGQKRQKKLSSAKEHRRHLIS
ncbi:protein EMBRYONIC FLOWER 1 [Euphorbia lathyris]|uniref:protein EMBRYONIC FLOWER 1 n=1 Tax=Euphorbia lathyris TaxID=212925 RepID=UPI003313D7F3